MICLACNNNIDDSNSLNIEVRCNQCGVFYFNGSHKEVYRTKIEIGTTEDQIEGLKDLIKVLEKNNINNNMVEIGTLLGASAVEFSKIFNHVYCVDIWKYWEDYPKFYEGCIFNLRNYKNISLIRKESNKAHLDFKDKSLDFVYIDGNHEEAFVEEDIKNWLPKIKNGGIIGGHDYGRSGEAYNWEGLTRAVDRNLGKPSITFRDTSWLFFL